MPYRERALRVVLAPNPFAGSLTAAEAASAMAAGVADAAASSGVPLAARRVPVSDGGPGLVAAAETSGFAASTRLVTGPLGNPVQTTYALGSIEGRRTAVVELAQASGLASLGSQPTPQTAVVASTYGVGELITAALDDGAQRLVLGLGGSATTDGGTGLLTALGARFLDAAGRPLAPGGGSLRDLATVDGSGLDPRLRDTEVVLACDVDSPLTGPQGAAAVFAPQKGAGPAEVAQLAAGLRRLAEVIRHDLGTDVSELPGGGAAGGTAAGAMALLGARAARGIDVVLDLVRFDDALAGAAVTITGEGFLDAQTLTGKAPLGVVQRAAARGVPVLIVAGKVRLTAEERHRLARAGCLATYALTDLQPDLDLAMANADGLTRRATAELLASWLAVRHVRGGTP